MDVEIKAPEKQPGKPVAVKHGRRTVGLSFRHETIEQVDYWAKRRGLTRSGMINSLVTEGLERLRAQTKPEVKP